MKIGTLKNSFSLVIVFLLALVPAFGKTGFVFVEPFPSSDQVIPKSLSEARIMNVRGGRAFFFKVVEGNQDPRLQVVSKSLNLSKAVQKALELRELARKMGPAPCQDWLTSDSPVPVWVLPKGAGGKGPGVLFPIPLRVLDKTESWDASSLLILEPLLLPGKIRVEPEELAESGLLVPIFCHEIFHLIQAELYRERILLLDILSKMPGVPHDSPLETDPQMALKEGFAEFGELWLASLYPAEFRYSSGTGCARPPVAAFGQQMHKARIKLAERNRYIFQANGRVKDGQLKSGNTDLATEGVIASLLFTLAGHANWRSPIICLFNAMSHGAPASFFELIGRLIKENPEQAQTIRRILLEYTCYTIQSREALKMYENYYLTRKAFLVGKVKREEYEKAKFAWRDWKEAQLRKIASGTPLCEAVPHPFIVTSRQGYSLDLNDELPDRLAWHLEAFMPPGDPKDASELAKTYAKRIVDRRKELGVFESVDQVDGIVPQWLSQKLKAGFRRYLLIAEKRLNEEVTRRRTLKGF